jgi:hypothetical protein
METREWDEETISNDQFRKETDEYLARNKKTHSTIMETMMGEDFEDYFETPEALAEKAEFIRDAMREEGDIEQQNKYLQDSKMGL